MTAEPPEGIAADAAEADAQELAEVFGETKLTEDGADIAGFDEPPDACDVAGALGDWADDPAIEEADLAPEDFDEDDPEGDEDDALRDGPGDQPEDGIGKERVPTGPGPDDVQPEVHPHQDELLDEGLEETFPASDPVSVKRIT